MVDELTPNGEEREEEVLDHESPFRGKAFESLSAPEQIDRLMMVITPKGWIALLCLAGCIIAALIWAFVGEIPIEVHGKGVILTPKGVFNISAPKEGLIKKLYVNVGDWVTSETVIAELAGQDQSTPQPIYAGQTGEILEIYMSEGDWVKAGEEIAWAKFPLGPGQTHIAYAYFPVDQGEKIVAGMEAKLKLNDVDSASYGLLYGQVTEVSEFPLSDRQLLSRFRNEQLVQYIKQGAISVTKATIALVPDRNTPSGYRWTTRNGPDRFIEAGDFFSASIIISERKPITYLLPILYKQKMKPMGQNPDIFPEKRVENP